jgi:hypothetical protein
MAHVSLVDSWQRFKLKIDILQRPDGDGKWRETGWEQLYLLRSMVAGCERCGPEELRHLIGVVAFLGLGE